MIKNFFLIFLFALGLIILFFSQKIVVTYDTIEQPDYIIVLGGGGGVRLDHYAKTSHVKYPSVPLVLTGGIMFFGKPGAKHMLNFSEKIGIKVNKILIPTSKSTFDDALHLKKYFQEKDLKPTSLMVITSDFHSGRAYWVFQRVFPEIKIYISPAPDKLINKKWWKDYNTAQYVLEEKARFLFYRLVVIFNPSILKI